MMISCSLKRVNSSMIKRFSDRIGKTRSKDLQIDSLDEVTKNRIWSYIHEFFMEYSSTQNVEWANNRLFVLAWRDFFKNRLTTTDGSYVKPKISSCYDKLEWYEIYNFLEFLVEHSRILHGSGTDTYKSTSVMFEGLINNVLEQENSAYRLIEGMVTNITEEGEISVVEDALKDVSKISGVKLSLDTARKLLWNKGNPDPRNSIKESISAVEGFLKEVLEGSKITISKDIHRLVKDKRFKLSEELAESWVKLYHYTCNKDGVRHGSNKTDTCLQSEARYMLVTCSSFISGVTPF